MLFIALDTDDKAVIDKLTTELRHPLVGFKVGPRFLMQFGPHDLGVLCRQSKVFLDCKFHDIPETMAKSLSWAGDLGVQYATVHCSAGAVALQKSVEVESSFVDSLKLLGVTVLTHHDQQSLPQAFRDETISTLVSRMVVEAQLAGLTGFVCSPHEVRSVREALKRDTDYLVTPGIRRHQDALGDQIRVTTPEQARQLGVNAIVVGRPIVTAADPMLEAQSFLKLFGVQ